MSTTAQGPARALTSMPPPPPPAFLRAGSATPLDSVGCAWARTRRKTRVEGRAQLHSFCAAGRFYLQAIALHRLASSTVAQEKNREQGNKKTKNRARGSERPKRQVARSRAVRSQITRYLTSRVVRCALCPVHRVLCDERARRVIHPRIHSASGFTVGALVFPSSCRKRWESTFIRLPVCRLLPAIYFHAELRSISIRSLPLPSRPLRNAESSTTPSLPASRPNPA